MIELTSADFVAMEAAWNATGSQKAKLRRERIYRAGLAAGIERAAQTCDTLEDCEEAAYYAASIRALNPPA